MPDRRLPDQHGGSDAGPLRVLVVDDQELNRRVMQTLLGEFGCSVTLADCGEEAIQHAGAAAFDLVLMDLHMPGLDGDETARRLREAGASRWAFIARWSTDPPARLDVGLYDGALPKPITLAALAGAVDNAARRASNRADKARAGSLAAVRRARD